MIESIPVTASCADLEALWAAPGVLQGGPVGAELLADTVFGLVG
ncbi:MAG: hypothetical protein WA895_37545 [Streptosporangiaceae bacterium]